MQPDPRSEVDTVVADLRAALDEDDQLARAAVIPAHDGPTAYKPHPELAVWRYVPGGEVEYVSTPEMQSQQYAETYRVTCDSEGILPAVDERVGPHIARHDPARVLALVAAHREILDLYETAKADPDREHDPHVNGYIGGLNAAATRLASAYADRDDESERST